MWRREEQTDGVAAPSAELEEDARFCKSLDESLNSVCSLPIALKLASQLGDADRLSPQSSDAQDRSLVRQFRSPAYCIDDWEDFISFSERVQRWERKARF